MPSTIRHRLTNRQLALRVRDFEKLYNASRPAQFFYMYWAHELPDWNEEGARGALRHGYVDYFQGRLIKVDFRDNRYTERDESLFDLYDGAYGEGAAARALGWRD